MKSKFLNMVIISLLFAGFAVNPAPGQEKTQEQKAKEEKLQQAIELQKKALNEQIKIVEQQAGDLSKIYVQEGDRSAGSRGDQGDLTRRGRQMYFGRDGSEGNSFMFGQGGDFSGFGFFRGGGDGERTSLDFSKSVKESSFSRQFSFDVGKGAKNVVMNIMGDCKEGEIKVKIVMPGGKTYSDIVIDASGNLNWRKSFAITEEENKDKTGEWVFKIEASKATGYFRISLQTY